MSSDGVAKYVGAYIFDACLGTSDVSKLFNKVLLVSVPSLYKKR